MRFVQLYFTHYVFGILACLPAKLEYVTVYGLGSQNILAKNPKCYRMFYNRPCTFHPSFGRQVHMVGRERLATEPLKVPVGYFI